MSDIYNNGIRIDRKQMDTICATCGNPLYLCTYKYYKTFKKLAECFTCKTYIEVKTEREKKLKAKRS